MSENPDVAALVEWLQTWSPVTANGQRAHLAASELTRLAAEHRDQQQVVLDLMNERDEAKAEIARLTEENRTYAEAHTFNSERFGEVLSERDAAKAEIARLTAERDEWQRQHDLKDHRCFALAQRAEKAEAEIARVEAPLTVIALEYAFLKDAYDVLKLDTEKAEAEIARLRAVAQEDPEREAHDRLGEFFLKPDTGALPPCMAPDGGECCPQYHAAKAEIARLRGTLEYILAQAEQGYPTVLSVIKANAKAALDDEWQKTYRAAYITLKPDTGEKP